MTLPAEAAAFEARRAELKGGEDAAAAAAKAAKPTATVEKPQPGPPAPKPASNN